MLVLLWGDRLRLGKEEGRGERQRLCAYDSEKGKEALRLRSERKSIRKSSGKGKEDGRIQICVEKRGGKRTLIAEGAVANSKPMGKGKAGGSGKVLKPRRGKLHPYTTGMRKERVAGITKSKRKGSGRANCSGSGVVVSGGRRGANCLSQKDCSARNGQEKGGERREGPAH